MGKRLLLLLGLVLVASATLAQAGQVKSNEPIELTYWSTYGHAPNIVSAFGATGPSCSERTAIQMPRSKPS